MNGFFSEKCQRTPTKHNKRTVLFAVAELLVLNSVYQTFTSVIRYTLSASMLNAPVTLTSTLDGDVKSRLVWNATCESLYQLHNVAELVCLNDEDSSLRWVCYDNLEQLLVDVNMINSSRPKRRQQSEWSLIQLKCMQLATHWRRPMYQFLPRCM